MIWEFIPGQLCPSSHSHIYEAIGCTVVLCIVNIFKFYHWVQISVLLSVFLFCICNTLDGWLGNGSYGGTGDQSVLKFFVYSLYSFTIRCMISTYFLFYCWLSFQTHCTLMQSSYNFDIVQFINIWFYFVACAFGVISGKSFVGPISRNISCTFTSRSFIHLGLRFRSLNHFEFVFVSTVR